MRAMMHLISKALLWRTVASGLLIFDYFLFVTGNPSITYSFLGGWFAVPLVLAAIVTGSYGYGTARREVKKGQFFMHAFAIGVLVLALFVTNAYARGLARTRLELTVASFIRDPMGSKADVSSAERKLMAEIRRQEHTMEYETFIPTFRRMDYLFVTSKTGERYRLIVTMDWKGTPVIWLRRVET